MSEEFGNDFITITDDEGNEYEFEVLDMAEIDDNVYAALIPVTDDPEELAESDGQLVILKIVETEDGDEMMENIENEEELNKVLDEFEKRLTEDYEISE